MGSNLNIIDTCKEIQDSLPSQEYALGKGLLQPFNNCNSGSRKIMQGIQKEQGMQLENSETPIIMTGFENQFGELSSSFIRAERNYIVKDKISKFGNDPKLADCNYWLICLDPTNGIVDAIERIDYRHISESYGYRLDTKYIDRLGIDDRIPQGTPIVKAKSFDSAGNKCDGVNLTTVYMALAHTTEDPIVISESAAKKFTSPLFGSTMLQINDNDILLNMYGDNEHYKTFPDIGEDINGGLLCSIRRERKDDEALYTQSWDRLRESMISDDRYTLNGKVIDINVYCNNIEKLESSIYNQQIAKYYHMQSEFCHRVIASIDPWLSKGMILTYEAERLYYRCKDILAGKQFIKDKVFNNIVMEIITMEMKPLRRGDKITDRYGGKGVVSDIRKDELMPKYKDFYPDGKFVWQPVDAIYNSSTIINRENPGQSFETECTYVGIKIVERIAAIINTNWDVGDVSDVANIDRCEKMVYEYMNILNPEEAAEYQYLTMSSTASDRLDFLESIVFDGAIYIYIMPISGGMCLDKLAELYEAFPWVQQSEILVPQKGSNGQYRFILARRSLIVGKKYIYRLKQYAEEKMTAVSLASTNIRSENTKSKSNKLHKSVHATTPVRFGEMELEDLMHMMIEHVIKVLLLISSSPMGRRLSEQLLVGDPLDRNVMIEADCTSRSVENVNAYSKTAGLRMIFLKVLINKSVKTVREVVRKVPGIKCRPMAARRVPAQFRNKLNNIIEQRIHAMEDKDLEAIYSQVDGLDREDYLKQYITNTVIDIATDIMDEQHDHPIRYESEVHVPINIAIDSTGKCGITKEALEERLIHGKPKKRYPRICQRDIVTRVTQPTKDEAPFKPTGEFDYLGKNK